MGNTFFEMHQSPEQYDEVYEKWLKVTPAEQKNLNPPKSRIYVSVEDIETIQDALETMILMHDPSSGIHTGANERKLRQMGYGLEEIKQKLIKRTQSGH